MRTARARRTAVGLVLLVATTAACSEPEDGYCEALAAEEKTLTELAARDSGDVLAPTAESFERLQGEAPDELRDEWDTVVGAYQVLLDTIEELGIDPGDYDPEDPPDDVSAAEARRLASVAGALRSSRVQDAVAGIQEHAGSVCGVDFDAS